ncbi:hypothetical protein BDP27DRAFT_1361919 [Rhodocollybia butyracea]|uniref:Uncharacterized protein n=1 Tax=Rhodocollybia butyracea TaxID=206335 RepID=A0A9P5U9U4_9AGAR|nr:hypothetical protein BDP27DRAFT_1361919 [Rhodocollybia butyracea]
MFFLLSSRTVITSFVFILLQLGVNALPVLQSRVDEHAPPQAAPSSQSGVQVDPDRVEVGVRYVTFEAANELNFIGEPIPIPARGRQLGEGLYLSRQLGKFPGKLWKDAWERAVALPRS